MYNKEINIIECAVRYVERTASEPDYSPEDLSVLRRAFQNLKEAIRKLEVFEWRAGTCPLSKGDRPRIFFDMDGTLSEWEDNPIEEVAKPGYFYSRKPVASMVEAIKELYRMDRYEIYILSSVFMDSHSVSEKIAWNARYTGLPNTRQMYVLYGQDKNEYLEQCGGIRSSDILVDDFSYNLHKWKGVGIKVYNGVNGTKGTWSGLSVRNTSSAEEIVETIAGIASGTC